MADDLDFTVSLNEQVSGAAHKAGESLHGLSNELVHTHGGIERVRLGFFSVVEPAEVVRHGIEGVTSGLKEMGAALSTGEARGVVTGFAEALGGAAQQLDLLIPGLGQLAGAAVRAGGAIVGALVGIGQKAVEEAIEVGEVNERLVATFDALGEAPGAGQKTLSFLNDLSKELPQSRAQLATWTKQFQALGITDLGALRTQLLATASAQAIMGDEGANAYQMLTEKINIAIEAHSGLKLGERQLRSLYSAGLNVTDVADHMGMSVKNLEAALKRGTINAEQFGSAISTSLIEKGQKPLEAMGNEFGTLKDKFFETIAHLFDGIDTSPITDALKSVIDLGSQGEPSGQALKSGINTGLNAIVKEIGVLIHEGEIMFLDLEIGWLKNKTSITEIISDAKILAGVFIDVAKAVGAIVSTIGGAGKAVTDFIGKAVFLATDAEANAQAKRAAGQSRVGSNIAAITATLTGHQHGGIVTGIHGGIANVRPHPGEGIASIGMGERIVPRDAYSNVGARLSTRVANDNTGHGGGVQVGRLEINVTAPSGVTNAQDLSVTGLTIALERLQLASGR